MTISNAITETIQSHVYKLQYIDCSRPRGPGLSSVLEHARAVGAGGGGVMAGRVMVALPSPLGPAAAAQLTRSGSLGPPAPTARACFRTDESLGPRRREQSIYCSSYTWDIPAQIDQPRGRFNIIMSAISIKFAVIGYSWALITNIKLVFEYIFPFRNYSLRRF